MFVFCFVAVESFGAIVYVSPLGSTNSTCGAIDFPCQTILMGVAKCGPFDIVALADGLYYGPGNSEIVVYMPGITIKAINKNKAVIMGKQQNINIKQYTQNQQHQPPPQHRHQQQHMFQLTNERERERDKHSAMLNVRNGCVCTY
jgi:hypothetical protein